MKEYNYTEARGLDQLVEKQIHSYNLRSKAPRDCASDENSDVYRFIAISQDAGSFGEAVASELAWEIGWHVFDKEVVEHIAKNSHVRESIVRELDEKAKNLVHDAVERLLRLAEGTPFGEEDYHQGLIKALATLSAQGRAIFLGHGAAFALRGLSGLRVRITASRSTRVGRLRERWAISKAAVDRRVRQLDDDLRRFVRHHFGVDREHLQNFDLAYNTDHLSIAQVAASLKATIQNRQAHENGVLQLPSYDVPIRFAGKTSC
jgi:cytidylate kinase